MKQIIFLLASVASFFFLSGCTQTPQYGVTVLKLDNFDFNLNIEQFFQDESIFRYTNEDYSVRTNEEHIQNEDVDMWYIRYSTYSSSAERPLASYAGVQFESLDIIADETDEQVLMAIGTTGYANVKKVETIINQLKKEYADSVSVLYGYYNGSYPILKFKQGDKRATLYIGVEVEGGERPSYWDDEPVLPTLTDEAYELLKKAMNESEENEEGELNCTLFLTNATFDHALNVANSYSGDLTRYK